MNETHTEGDGPKKNIPISVSLRPTLESERQQVRNLIPVKRVLYLSLIAVVNALIIGVIARGLIALISLEPIYPSLANSLSMKPNWGTILSAGPSSSCR